MVWLGGTQVAVSSNPLSILVMEIPISNVKVKNADPG